MSMNTKEKKLIIVVNEVIKTGFPTSFNLFRNLFFLSLILLSLELTKCIISETVTIKKIAGDIIINNSMPPKKNNEIEVLANIVIRTQLNDINKIAIFFV